MLINETTELNPAEVNKEKIIAANTTLFRQIKDAIATSFTDIWNNGEMTPQEALDAFGSDATALFILSAKAQDLLKAIDPEYEYLTPPTEVKFNEDGTVTVGK